MNVIAHTIIKHVIKFGTSNGILLDSYMLKFLDIDTRDKVRIECITDGQTGDKSIVITKTKR